MRRIAALVFVVAVGYMVRAQGAAGATVGTSTLALGFTLIAATLAGALFERVHLPRVTGYLVFGLACGPYLLDIITSAMAAELKLLNGLAVALIGFMAGLEIDLAAVRPRLASVLRFSGTMLAAVFVILLAAFWLAWPWLPIAPDATGLPRLALSMLLATLVTSFSPAVTMAVIAESRAEGPFAQLMVLVVVVADLALILAFTIVLQFVRSTLGGGADEIGLLARLAWDVGGSIAFGALVGAAFAFYVRFVGREVTLVLIAVCVVLSEVGRQLHVEAVLAALAAGLVVENVAPPQGHALRQAVERGALPVLIVFFFAAGAAIELRAMASIGVIAVGVSLLRVGAIRLGVAAGLRVSSAGTPHAGLVWMGLVSQAGVTLGLCFIVTREFPGLGAPLETLVIALVGLHELVGPILLRTALVRAGDAGRLDTVGRPEGRPLQVEADGRPA